MSIILSQDVNRICTESWGGFIVCWLVSFFFSASRCIFIGVWREQFLNVQYLGGGGGGGGGGQVGSN